MYNLKKRDIIEIAIIISLIAIQMLIMGNIIYSDIQSSKNYHANIETFNIYYQEDYDDISIVSTVQINNNKSMKEKLQLIADEVSKYIFEGKKIKVLKVENNIAYIDLIDSKNKEWYGSFQGSFGASCTSYALLENFLQENYNGEWISGIYFTHNGKVVEMKHMGIGFFGEIIYREPKYYTNNYINVPFDYVEEYIDINDYTIEDYFYVDINLDGIDDEVLLIHRGNYQSIYYDPMIYILNGESNETLTIIPINPFNPSIYKIEDVTGDGIPDISIKFDSNTSGVYSDILYEYEDGRYISRDVYTNDFNIYASSSSYFSSDFYDKKNISYKPEMVLDTRPRTSWIEGAYGNGQYEWIKLDFDRTIAVDNIYILNGLGDVTGNYYYKNNRVKTMLLEFSDGEELVIELEDNFIREQEINIDTKLTSYIKFTILEVYEGSKFDDTCIGSISINNPRIYNYSLDNNSNKQFE